MTKKLNFSVGTTPVVVSSPVEPPGSVVVAALGSLVVEPPGSVVALPLAEVGSSSVAALVGVLVAGVSEAVVSASPSVASPSSFLQPTRVRARPAMSRVQEEAKG